MKNYQAFLAEKKRMCSYSEKILILFPLFFVLVAGLKAQTTQSFSYTGGAQSFTVPACVNTLSVNISGAKGGNGLNPSGPGGWGGVISAVISVTPGQVLNLFVGGAGGSANLGVGGAGGYNGGGAGASGGLSFAGGGGGGASDIRVSPYGMADRLIVAGGGGGGGTFTNTASGDERGGSGGTSNGENGYSGNSNINGNGGAGGSNSSGGSGGFVLSLCTAQSGSLGLGGAATTCSNGGGGGGGGYYGGGGGISAGGGGGSSYAVPSSSTVVHSLGASSGNGIITIVYAPVIPTINIAPSSNTTCSGSALSFTASGGVNYTWTTFPASQTITGQSILNHTFTSPGAYAIIVTGSNIFGCTASSSTVVTINASPLMVASATKTLICSGNPTTLYVAGASSCQWDANANNATTPSTIVSPTVTTVYQVIGTLSATGCTATASTTIHIYQPSISVAGGTAFCSGKSTTLTANVINPAVGSSSSYTWTGPAIPPTQGPVVVLSPTALTVYSVSAKSVTNANVVCTVSKTVAVLVHNNPIITVTLNPMIYYICKGEPYTMVAQGALSYTWNNGVYAGSTLTAVQNVAGTYTYVVMGTDANGCVGDTVHYIKILHCHPTGIEALDQNNNHITICPNPNSGEFQIASERDMTIKLMNELGQTVREFELNAYNARKVQVADLAKGIYFISGSGNHAVTRQKIIIR